MKEVFQEIYETNKWGNGSGSGSDPDSCAPYLSFLTTYYKKGHALEIGCGDMQMYSRHGIPFKTYRGLDLLSFPVWDRISKLNPNHSFEVYDGEVYCLQLGYSALAYYSVILLKDVLNHHPLDFIKKLVDHLLVNKADAHLVMTHDWNPEFPTSNTDINVGEHRPLDLTSGPFDYHPRFSFIWNCVNEGRKKQTLVL